MPKALIFILVIIALALLGAEVFWWYSNKESAQSVMFRNTSPDLSQETAREEPLSPQENIRKEIETLEEEKEKELSASVASSIATPVATPSDPPNSSPKITNRLMNSGFAVPKSPRKIDTIVLHSSYNSLGGDPYSVEKIVAIYKDYGVGAHYIIDREGTIHRLVEDKNIAYHAGASKMPDGRTNVNDFSLGIELVNTMEDTYRSAQYQALNDLTEYLKKTYSIKHIVGHSDIAPGRKTDPWSFDWKKLE